MQLQTIRPALEAAGIALYAVSYDPVDSLAAFAGRYSIGYPLLSDPDSAVIRSLGILNEGSPPATAGIPHPGVFVLDEAGTVTGKHFYPSYRERDTGVGLLEHALGIAAPTHGPSALAADQVVQARAWFDSPSYTWGQRLWLTVELTIAGGHAVYASPVPDGYQALTVDLTLPERVIAGDQQWPPARAYRMDTLDEQFHVYEGTVRVDIPVTFMVVDAGDLATSVEVTLQACTPRECLLPASLHLSLTLPELPLIERPPRPS